MPLTNAQKVELINYIQSVPDADYPAFQSKCETVFGGGSGNNDYEFVKRQVATECKTRDPVAMDAAFQAANIDKIKKAKCADIDRRTRELIGEGFVWAGETFSLSLNAQRYWTGLKTAKDAGLPVTYPLKVNTKDDAASKEIPDGVAIDTIFATVFSVIKGHLGSGTDLKDQVRAAATVADVDAIVDNR